MNILICTSSDSSFNSIRPELEIFIGLAKAGHNITIITHHNDIYSQKFKDAGINLIEKPVVKKLSWQSISLIRSVIKKHHIDVVYATNSKAIPNTAFACIGTKAKMVAYRGTANGLYWHDPGNYISSMHPRIDGYICVSQYVTDYVASKWLLRNKKIQTIYKGHDLDWYDDDPADLAEFGISKEDFVAIAVINSRPHKGLDIILKASYKLSDLEQLHILLVGKGTDKEPYNGLLEKSPMNERIHIAGYRNDVPSLMKSSHVLLQPSVAGEGLPRVILESLACGTPVIASSIPGSQEIISDGMNGLIVPAGDPSALAQTISELYDNRTLLNRLSKQSMLTIIKKMSHTKSVQSYSDLFESLLM